MRFYSLFFLFDISRTKYIGKEIDKESNLADHGVRKYENEVGVFTSIDPLWENYRGWSPYQYSGNNPIMALDWNGKWITSNNSHLLVQDFSENFRSDNIEFSYKYDKLNILDKRQFSIWGVADPTYNNHEFNVTLKEFEYLSSVKNSNFFVGYIDPEQTIENAIGSKLTDLTLSQTGGELTFDKLGAVFITKEDYFESKKNGILTRDYRETLLMHGFGHIFFKNEHQGKVVDFDNLMRIFSGHEMRIHDDKHPKP